MAAAISNGPVEGRWSWIPYRGRPLAAAALWKGRRSSDRAEMPSRGGVGGGGGLEGDEKVDGAAVFPGELLLAHMV